MINVASENSDKDIKSRLLEFGLAQLWLKINQFKFQQ